MAKKPLLKRPIIWVAVGLVIIGAAAKGGSSNEKNKMDNENEITVSRMQETTDNKVENEDVVDFSGYLTEQEKENNQPTELSVADTPTVQTSIPEAKPDEHAVQPNMPEEETTPTATPENVPTRETPTDNGGNVSSGGTEYNGRTVYVTPKGKKYHYDKECAGPNAMERMLDAVSGSYGPCGTCVLK